MSLIGRQPISDSRYKIMGYDILFRDESLESDSSDISISASVIERILNSFGLENVLGGYLGFLKIDIQFLKSDILLTIPKEHFILMILESSFFHPDLPDILQRLHGKGYRFGINNCVLNTQTVKQIEFLHPWLDYIRIDALRNINEYGKDIYKHLKSMHHKLIAIKVETQEIFEQFKKYDIDYFQGYYIKRPHTIEHESLSMPQEQILQVWNLLRSDADVGDIVKTLEESHALLLHLLQFINSSFFSFTTSIKSIRQVITLVGRDALANWLLLMLVSHKSDIQTNTNFMFLLRLKRLCLKRKANGGNF